MGLPWFRFYNESLDSLKVQSLPSDLFRAWVNLLCLAGKRGGVLPSVPDIAFALRISRTEAQASVSSLAECGLLDETEHGLMPHDWEHWQPRSDNSTPRVQKHREAKRREAVSATKGNGSGNGTEEIRGEETRAEESRAEETPEPPLPPQGTRPAAPILEESFSPPLKFSSPKSQRLPEAIADWWEQWIGRYPEHRAKVQLAAQKFIDLWFDGKITQADLSELDAGLDRYLLSENWADDNGKWVPSAVKFLADGAWLDRPKPSTEAKGKIAYWTCPWTKEVA